MGGRIDIEADDVLEFLGELRVVRQLERADAMRCELVGFENTLHMISAVPQPSAGARMMLARHTCF